MTVAQLFVTPRRSQDPHRKSSTDMTMTVGRTDNEFRSSTSEQRQRTFVFVVTGQNIHCSQRATQHHQPSVGLFFLGGKPADTHEKGDYEHTLRKEFDSFCLTFQTNANTTNKSCRSATIVLSFDHLPITRRRKGEQD
jgi:hypothetical protein